MSHNAIYSFVIFKVKYTSIQLLKLRNLKTRNTAKAAEFILKLFRNSFFLKPDKRKKTSSEDFNFAVDTPLENKNLPLQHCLLVLALNNPLLSFLNFFQEEQHLYNCYEQRGDHLLGKPFYLLSNYFSTNYTFRLNLLTIVEKMTLMITYFVAGMII